MESKPTKRRRSIRLRGHDYSESGAYFVTACSHNRQCLFGEIVADEMRLNEIGRILETEWVRTGTIRPNVVLDASVVMPNHFHGIIVIEDDRRRGTARRAPTAERFAKPVPRSLPTIVRSLKSAVTKRTNELRGTPGATVWQRNYHEHVVRNADELNRIRQYITTNPLRWSLDRENPNRVGTNPEEDWLYREEGAKSRACPGTAESQPGSEAGAWL